MKNADRKSLYGAITKIEDQPDGTVVVEGIAQAEERDSAKELIRASGMRKAIPDFMKFANIREMHQPIAAGTALSMFVDDDGRTNLKVHVVDEGSVRKVKTGVLKGFSIGGNVLKRNDQDRSIIEELELFETSLVDRPCLPTAVFQIAKVDKLEPVAAEPLPVVVGTATVAAPLTEKPAAVVKTAKRVLTDEIRKGLYSVGYLAETISSLNCIAQDATFEADYEGDDSPIPARLKAAVNELCAILRDMAAEETAELTGEGDVLAMAAKPGALKKSEKFAAICKAFIAAARGNPYVQPDVKLAAAQALLEKAMAAVAPPPADAEALTKRATDAEKSAADALAKVAAAETEKAAAEEATKLAGDALQKVMGERDELTKALARANAELATKGVLRVVAVEKAADGRTEKADENAPPAGTAERALYEIRKVQASGGRPLNNR